MHKTIKEFLEHTFFQNPPLSFGHLPQGGEDATLINRVDLEILLAEAIGKSREFVLAYPEYKLTQKQELKINNFVKRRIEGEPVAYIIGHKEFYGLNFKINKHTLIPRPETELMIDEVLKDLNTSVSKNNPSPCLPCRMTGSSRKSETLNELASSRVSIIRDSKINNKIKSRIVKNSNLLRQLADQKEFLTSKMTNCYLIDIGTGSGNIIISLAKELAKLSTANYELIATDISKGALKIAKQNAQKHNVAKKITFLQGDLLESISQNGSRISDFYSAHPSQEKSTFPPRRTVSRDGILRVIITANLPYLSKEIYNSCAKNVKNFEPKTALYSPKAGLAHYEKLFQQLKKIMLTSCEARAIIFLEISPEQKNPITKLIKKYFSKAEVKFKKDLAGKWRLCKISHGPTVVYSTTVGPWETTKITKQ